MCKESQYLVEQFRNVLEYYEEKHKLSDLYFIFKNFYEVTDNDGETYRIWFEEDLNPNMKYIKKTIIGLSRYNSDSCYINWININVENSIAFSYSWKTIGKFTVSFEDLLKDSFDDFMKSIYVQLLLYIDKGNDIYVSSDLLFKKNSTYEILMETDFNT